MLSGTNAATEGTVADRAGSLARAPPTPEPRRTHALRVWVESCSYGDELSLEQRAFAEKRILDFLDYLATLSGERERYPAIGQAILLLTNDKETLVDFKDLPGPKTLEPRASLRLGTSSTAASASPVRSNSLPPS
jgi:hypothetical protein